MGIKYISPAISASELEEDNLLMVSNWNNGSVPDTDNDLYNY